MRIFGLTDVGLVRDINQDRFRIVIMDNISFAIVCDGMGGQSGGHIASEMTCNVIERRLCDSLSDTNSDEEIQKLLISAVSEANFEVYKTSNVEPGCRGMGTTAITIIIKNNKAFIAHIGDSRVYMLQNGVMNQITKDHSLVQELVDRGEISREEALYHPNKNMITRAVGVNLQVDIDYFELNLSEDTKLLICTDGLTNMVDDDTIARVLSETELKNACQVLVELANNAGGTDNITAVAVG